MKNAQNQAHRAHANPPLPPVEPMVPSDIKVHTTVVNGVIRAVAMLACGPQAVIVGEALSKLSVTIVSAALGQATLDAWFEHVW